MATTAELTLTVDDALLVISTCCFNQILRHRVNFDVPGVKSTYDVAAIADRRMRDRYGKNCHELKALAEKTLRDEK